MNKTLYLHTLDGSPAAFDGYQICFIGINPRGGRTWAEPCKSLDEIRQQQAASHSNRIRDGLGDSCRYGYIRIKAPR